MTYKEFTQRYQYNPLTDLLSEKGNTTIYKAYDTFSNLWVVIKRDKVSSQFSTNLKDEVILVKSLSSHPNIANYTDCYTFSSLEETYNFALQKYYKLGSLEDFIKKQDFRPYQKEIILRYLLDGIEFLHKQDIIHGRLTPSHILLEEHEDDYIPKISHFANSQTINNINTDIYINILQEEYLFYYSSPEQLTNGEITFSTDLWSFGVIACWLLLGKIPFDSGPYEPNSSAGKLEFFRQIGTGELPTFLEEELSYLWSSVIKKCLVKDPKERVKNVKEIREIIENIKNEEIKPIKDNKEKWGFVNGRNILVIPCIYEEYRDVWGAELIEVKLGEKYGFINRIGVEKTPIKYDMTKILNNYFPDGRIEFKLIGVEIEEKWGIINNKGKEITSIKYDSIGVFLDGLIAVKLNNKWGFINEKGEEVIPIKYDLIGNYDDDLSPYDSNMGFYEGIAKVYINGKCGIINKKGQLVVPIEYQIINTLMEKNIGLGHNNKYGFVDREGNEITPLKYDSIYDFKGNRAKVLLSNKWGVINDVGEEITPIKYDEISYFEKGFATVSLNNKKGLINQKGEEIISIKYDFIYK